MINDEHREHKLHCHIICAYCHEGKLLDKLMAKSFKTPSSKLTDIAITTLPSSTLKNKSLTAPNLWMPSAMTSIEEPTPATKVMITHHLHPPWTVPTAHDSTHLAEQAALHRIPDAPNVTRLDTGD